MGTVYDRVVSILNAQDALPQLLAVELGALITETADRQVAGLPSALVIGLIDVVLGKERRTVPVCMLMPLGIRESMRSAHKRRN